MGEKTFGWTEIAKVYDIRLTYPTNGFDCIRRYTVLNLLRGEKAFAFNPHVYDTLKITIGGETDAVILLRFNATTRPRGPDNILE